MIQTQEATFAKLAPRLRRWPWAMALVWVCASVAGMWLLWRYASTPGTSADAPPSWPGNGLVKIDPDGSTLVMFAHPHCPCTRASMAELERLLAKCAGHVTAWIVFYKPSGADLDWEKTDLWHTAQAIPGAKLVTDNDGAEARRFGAATSGETLLYDAGGRLRFSGGITAARGHEGDNDGTSAILDIVNHGATALKRTPVFGCSIATCTLPLDSADTLPRKAR